MVRSRRLCFLVGIFTCCLNFGIVGRVPDARAAAQPNIVMIVADDAGYNDVHFDSTLTGAATTAETPNLDMLAQDPHTAVMRQGYSASPPSTAARAGLLSGVSPSRYGVEGDLPNDLNNSFGLPASEKILPSYLKDLGYQTMAIGKWHEGYTAGVNRPMDKGFDGFYGYLSGSRSYGKDTTPSNVLLDGNTSVENTWQSSASYLTDALGNKAVQYINDHAADSKPFFLYTALPAPHSPYQYIQADYNHFASITNTAQRAIAAQMLDMDRQIGNIEAELTTKGLMDNTIIVFVSDIGGGNLAYLPNSPYRGYQGQTWDGGIRVPYLIKAPGLAGGVYNSPVSTYDLLPTLYAAAGGDASQLTTDGTNIMPYLSGAQAGNPHAELVWRSRGAWAIRKGDLKLEHPDGAQPTVNALFDMAAHPTEPVGFNILSA
jgi:arylsulfatase A-like enzyme